MAYTYTISGGSIGTSNQLTAKVWSKLLHEQVQAKQIFKKWIGRDKGGEGSSTASSVNMPVVEVTNLKKEKGDQVTVPMARQLVTGGPNDTASYNAGKVGDTQLVDAESTMSWLNLKVKVCHQRQGVRIEDVHQYKARSPFDVFSAAKDMLGESLAARLDDGLIFAIYSRYSPNVFRELGITAAVPAENPNILYGNDRSALTTVTTADVISTELIDRLHSWVVTESINPIRTELGDSYLLLVSPADVFQLRRDSFWSDAQISGGVRGAENKMFSGNLGTWNGIYLFETPKISTALNHDGLTVTSNAITLSAETSLPGGITAAKLRKNILLGANAVGRAFAEETYMATRKEDDYGNIAGFAGGYVYGDARADWFENADTGTDGTAHNQSSAILYTYAPAAHSNISAVWS